jgi:tRNA(His) guanylyltransferase
MLRKAGESAVAATAKLDRLSESNKNELLYQQANINYNDLPNWQKRGIGLYWESYQKEATNLQTGEKVFATRRQIKVDMELPIQDHYSQFVRDFILREHPDR